MKTQSLIRIMALGFTIVFILHVLLVSFTLIGNYFNFSEGANGDEIQFSIRGDVNLTERNWNLLDSTEYTSIQKEATADPFILMKKSAFVRLDYSDLSVLSSLKMIILILFDMGSWLIWLVLTFQLMKILRSIKSKGIFESDVVIKRLRLIATVFITAPIISAVAKRMFTNLVTETLSINGHFIWYSRDFKYITSLIDHHILSGAAVALLILVLVEVFKRGIELKSETDLTI